jgi:hypothetical protein
VLETKDYRRAALTKTKESGYNELSKLNIVDDGYGRVVATEDVSRGVSNRGETFR